MLTGEEFANVAGRAGRAFIDVEGLVIHVMYEKKYAVERWRTQVWRNLVNGSKARTLESGLVLVVNEILDRLKRSGMLNRKNAFEYLVNNREAWKISVDEKDEEPFEFLVEKLDSCDSGSRRSIGRR